MSADTLFALIFIGSAAFAAIIGSAIDAGLSDRIAIMLSNYIVSRIERIEGRDI